MTNTNPALGALVTRLEDAEVLDAPAALLQSLADLLTSSDAMKDLLSGAQLGHPVHPLLTDIPIGCWTSASIIDVIAPRSGRSVAQHLTALGVLSAIPTAAAGLNDWSATKGGDRRVGVAHAVGNSLALLLEIASWSARRRGRQLRGVALGMAAIGVATAAGYLGGHLAFGTQSEGPSQPDVVLVETVALIDAS